MAAQLQDDPGISDDDELLRRVPAYHWIDCPGQRCRPSSLTFEDDPDGSLSVDIARLTTLAAVLSGHAGYALIGFTARVARENGLIVVADPLPLNGAHAIVVGNKTGSRRRALARLSVWVVAPHDAGGLAPGTS